MSPLTLIKRWLRFLFARFFPIPFILAGVALIFFGIRSLQQAKESISWPEVSGQIRSSAVEYHRSEKGGGTYHAEVFYQFTVNGQTHSGNRIAFGGSYGTGNPSHAQQIVNRYPKDKVVSVRYSPANPDVCVLEPGIQGVTWIAPAVGLVFIFVGFLLAIFLPRMMRKSRFR